MNIGLEKVYSYHHRKERGWGFLVLGEERGKFLRDNIGKNKNVLDIGCRDGALTKAYREGNNVLGFDIDNDALEEAKKNLGINIKHADINDDWGLDKESFDVVVAAEVIEHIYYPVFVLEKIYEVLKPGGKLVGSVPHAFSLQNRVKLFFAKKTGTTLSDPTHINHFSKKEFEGLLKKKFDEVRFQPIISNKFKLLAMVFPFLFAHTILFSTVKK